MDPDLTSAAKAMRSRVRRNRRLDWLLWGAIGVAVLGLVASRFF